MPGLPLPDPAIITSSAPARRAETRECIAVAPGFRLAASLLTVAGVERNLPARVCPNGKASCGTKRPRPRGQRHRTHSVFDRTMGGEAPRPKIVATRAHRKDTAQSTRRRRYHVLHGTAPGQIDHWRATSSRHGHQATRDGSPGAHSDSSRTSPACRRVAGGGTTRRPSAPWRG